MGLKESKKWAIGSIHENGGGKFEIIDRWFDEESDSIKLKYKFIESGKIEENKEDNVNSSEWKWRKVRGLTGSKVDAPPTSEEFINMTTMEEYFEGMYVRLQTLSSENKVIFKDMTNTQADQTQMLRELLTIVQVQQKQMEGMQKQIDTLIKDSAIINKLLDKIK